MIRQELTTDYTDLRQIVRNARVMEEKLALSELMACENTSHKQRAQISLKTAKLIENLRQSRRPDLLSQFIAEYNLNTEEGLSLMTLAESFLRVPTTKLETSSSPTKFQIRPGRNTYKVENLQL